MSDAEDLYPDTPIIPDHRTNKQNTDTQDQF